MNTELKLLFYIKKSEVKQDGTSPIMGRISIGRTMAQFSTKLIVSVYPFGILEQTEYREKANKLLTLTEHWIKSAGQSTNCILGL